MVTSLMVGLYMRPKERAVAVEVTEKELQKLHHENDDGPLSAGPPSQCFIQNTTKDVSLSLEAWPCGCQDGFLVVFTSVCTHKINLHLLMCPEGF